MKGQTVRRYVYHRYPEQLKIVGLVHYITTDGTSAQLVVFSQAASVVILVQLVTRSRAAQPSPLRVAQTRGCSAGDREGTRAERGIAPGW